MDCNPHCQHYLTRKKRYCKMVLLPGEQFCGQHITDKYSRSEGSDYEWQLVNFVDNLLREELPSTSILSRIEQEDCQKLLQQCQGDVRIKCPLDPSHTCFIGLLRKHLKKCNVSKIKYPNFYHKGLNGIASNQGLPLKHMTDEQVNHLINKLQYIANEQATVVHTFSKIKSLDCDSNYEVKPLAIKMSQIFSLLEVMEMNSMLQPNSCFLEMGAGRGEFTYRLCKYLVSNTDCSFLLLDRASVRHKADNRFKDVADIDMSRVRIDIRDFNLKFHPKVGDKTNLVIYSKHLCGNATDLCFRCCETCDDKLNGIIIALCCHHRCNWGDYVGKTHFLNCGFSVEDFTPLCGLTSWATCGLSCCEPSTTRESADHNMSTTSDGQPDNAPIKYKYSAAEREAIGRMAKLIIDAGRANYYLEKGYKAKLLYYIDRKFTPENVALIVRKEDIVC